MKNKNFDFIVIGTGMGGGTFGFALAKKGFKVLFIEKGNNYLDKKTLKGNYSECYDKLISDQEKRLKLSGRAFSKVYNDNKLKFPFIGSGTGGSSALYGMAMERFFPNDFLPRKIEFEHSDNLALPSEGWPFSYDDLSPYYSEAEFIYGVKGTSDKLKLDKKNGLSLPPEINKINKKIYNFLQMKGYNPYVLPRSSKFRESCIECQGFLCPEDCKIDSFNACVLPAIKNYNAEIITNAEVLSLETRKNIISNVIVSQNGEIYKIYGENVVLAAGAIYSPYLLLKSKSKEFPNGLSNSSGLVGKNLMRHLIDLYIVNSKYKIPKVGFMKEIAFNDLYNHKKGRIGTVQSFGRPPDKSIMTQAAIDKISKKIKVKSSYIKFIKPFISPLIEIYFSKKIIFNSIIEDLPYNDNSISLDPKTNIPIINFKLNSYEKNIIKVSRTVIKDIFKDAGVTIIKQAEDNKRLAHVCGTCRSGNDPKKSVVDVNCKSHDIKNLYISDASIFPTSGGTNPALTIAANALRISEKILK